MKFRKIEAGFYMAENGMTIHKHVPRNIFTGRPMESEVTWRIYKNGIYIDDAITLKRAKETIEKYYGGEL